MYQRTNKKTIMAAGFLYGRIFAFMEMAKRLMDVKIEELTNLEKSGKKYLLTKVTKDNRTKLDRMLRDFRTTFSSKVADVFTREISNSEIEWVDNILDKAFMLTQDDKDRVENMVQELWARRRRQQLTMMEAKLADIIKNLLDIPSNIFDYDDEVFFQTEIDKFLMSREDFSLIVDELLGVINIDPGKVARARVDKVYDKNPTVKEMARLIRYNIYDV